MTRQILTIIAVADLDAASRFYRAVFNWPVRIEVPVFVELELPDGRGFGVYQRDAFAANTGETVSPTLAGHTTGTELYFHTDDAEALGERILAAGGRLLSAWQARPWGDDAAYYADPDGNVVVLATPSSV